MKDHLMSYKLFSGHIIYIKSIYWWSKYNFQDSERAITYIGNNAKSLMCPQHEWVKNEWLQNEKENFMFPMDLIFSVQGSGWRAHPPEVKKG